MDISINLNQQKELSSSSSSWLHVGPQQSTLSKEQLEIEKMLNCYSSSDDDGENSESSSVMTLNTYNENILLFNDNNNNNHEEHEKEEQKEKEEYDDDNDDDNLEEDRMCYFIIGNLHRLCAELKDRGVYSNTSNHVSVSTAVKALQVATSCSYPTHKLANLLAKASNINPVISKNANDHSNTSNNTLGMDISHVWDVSIDLRALESQLDEYLMLL
mmetsp:Transcript_8793/g.10517  ORF Transcript_8793/g.10517 Transcript_8793/m.10517 type:complete len:216 (+) Transcript_8793:1607-2254(+)